jgi:hypothetical protein
VRQPLCIQTPPLPHLPPPPQGTNHEDSPELDDSQMHWTMDVVVVRAAEKLLDVLSGELKQVQASDGVHVCGVCVHVVDMCV